MKSELAAVQAGFVILSHQSGNSLRRLIDALDREYNKPPIAVHHDFGQSPLDKSQFRDEILWVEDWVSTGWAKWSVVEAALRAFRLLYQQADADWFFLLSASDYPVRSGKKTLEELAQSSFDAYVDARPLVKGENGSADLLGVGNTKLCHFESVSNKKIKRRFYFSPQWWIPIIRFSPKLRFGKLTYRPPFDGTHPFKNGIACFYGDHWFTANRKVIASLLDPSSLNILLQRHYCSRTQPDESYYATLFANTNGFRICINNRRYAEWNGGGAHPMILTSEQLPELFTSDAFFARKFGDDHSVIERIDAHLAANLFESV